jgi:hypothetical protein
LVAKARPDGVLLLVAGAEDFRAGYVLEMLGEKRIVIVDNIVVAYLPSDNF